MDNEEWPTTICGNRTTSRVYDLFGRQKVGRAGSEIDGRTDDYQLVGQKRRRYRGIKDVKKKVIAPLDTDTAFDREKRNGAKEAATRT